MRRAVPHFTTLLLALFLVASSGAPKSKREQSLERARALFDEATVDRANERWNEALSKLQQVASIKESAGVRYYMGICLMHLHRLKEALRNFRVAKMLAEEQHISDVLAVVDGRITDVSARIPTLFIRIPLGKQAIVRLDGEPIKSIDNPITLDPGIHHIDVDWLNGKTSHKQVLIEESKVFFEELREDPAPKLLSPPPISPAPQAFQIRVNYTPAVLSYSTSLAMLTSAGLSYYWSGRLADYKSNSCVPSVVCDPHRDEDINKYNHLGTTFLITGVVAGALGAYYTMYPPKRTVPLTTTTFFTPTGIYGTF